MRKLTVRFYSGHDGYIVAECLEIPGCMSQGKTGLEAKKNIANAIDACLEVMLENSLRKPRRVRPRRVAARRTVSFRLKPSHVAA